MKVFVLNTKNLDVVDLPQKIEGIFWIRDLDKQNTPAIMIEAREDKWVLKSNEIFQIIEQGNPISERTLELKKIYVIKSSETQKVLYITDDIDSSFGLYQIKRGINEVTFGTTAKDLIIYQNPYIKDRRMTIQITNNHFFLNKDKDDLIYINRLRTYTNSLPIKSGDEIFWFGLIIIVFENYIFINNPNKMVTVSPDYLFKMKYNTNSLPYYPIKEIPMYDDDDYFVRAPRLRRFISTYDITITPPPQKEKEEDIPFILLLGPMLTMAVTSSVSLLNVIIRISSGETTFAKSWTSVISSIAMLTAALVWPNVTKIWQKKQRKRKEKARIEKYTKYIDNKRHLLHNEIIKQQDILKENLLDLKTCYEIITQKQRILWERKINQQDFLTVRLGKGDIPLDVNISFNEDDFVMETDELKALADNLVKESKILKDMPVSYSFFHKNSTALIGQENLLNTVVDNIFLQLIAYHGYDELKIVVLTNKENANDWEYLKYLPHCFSDDKSIRFFATDEDEANTISDYLMTEYVSRINEQKGLLEKEEGKEDEKSEENVTYQPYYLIFTDDFPMVRKLGITEAVLKNKENYGFSFFVRESRLRRIPSECENFITVNQQSSGILCVEPSNNYQQMFTSELSNEYIMMDCARILANIPIEMDSERRYLPDVLGFLEMFHVGKVEQLNVLNRWRLNDPTKSLRALVGINDMDQPIYLDLHEKRHGPHGLIAGTTGSGKSEFIITYILSMALNYSPNEVAFILIDYKGGGLAGAFDNKANHIYLPHLAGTITNLDKNELNRTLVSIDSELKRRQQKFNEAREILGESTIDIYKYQRFFREGRLKEPIPHLFIICDEFAELKSQQPEFMDNLISAARIGRSLGVHLILATQKPSGVVNEQIVSNTRFRVCLKVASAGDSQEMLKKPDAALIKNAGRFYLQVGMDEIYVLGQSGWTGTKYIPKDTAEQDVDRSIDFVDNVLSVYKNVSNEEKKKVTESLGDEITNILQYITFLANRENVHAERLWFDNIPGIIYIKQLLEKYRVSRETPSVEAIIGEYDDPSNQKQGLLKLPLNESGNTLVYGLSGIGREMFLKSVIFSTNILYTSQDINYYMIDYGSESMRVFSSLPQVADIAYASDDEKVTKTIDFILKEIEYRKSLFSDYNGEYRLYCEKVEKLPIICLVINNFESFKETYQNYDDIFIRITREGKRYGVIMILTTPSPSGLFTKFTRNFDHVFALDMNDKSDYMNILGKIGNIVPADYDGRGLYKDGENTYEFQVATITDNTSIVDYIKEIAKRLAPGVKYIPKKIPILPEHVEIGSVLSNVSDLAHVPIGIEKDSLEVSTYNFTQSNANVVSANEMESIIPFIKPLIEILKSVPKTAVIVLDAEKKLDSSQLKVNGYCSSNMKEYLPKIENYIDTNIVNSSFNAVFVVLGLEKALNICDAKEFSRFVSKYAKNDNVRFIFADTVFNMKKYAFESWYSSSVNSSTGIWIGSNVMDQVVVKVSELDKKYREKVSDNFGWYIKNGSGTLVKLIEESDDYEE